MITNDTYSSSCKINKRFYNHSQEKLHGFFLRSLYMFFYGCLFQKREKEVRVQPPVSYSDYSIMPDLTITWIGHSTFLITCDGITILTDPIFGNASFLFKRIGEPGVQCEKLPPIDYILLSHNHRDHMDAKSLMRLQKFQPHILVPLGDKKWFLKRSFKTITEHDWWQSTLFTHTHELLTFTFLPAHHWSQRSLFDRNKSLWGSWMIQYKDYTLYFAGDSAYASHFLTIKEKFPTIDVALMPIGPCEPHAWLKDAHMNASQAGQAFLDLGAHNFIPMHWGTFYFGMDSLYDPIQKLQTWWQQQNSVTNDQLHILTCGEQWSSGNQPTVVHSTHQELEY